MPMSPEGMPMPERNDPPESSSQDNSEKENIEIKKPLNKDLDYECNPQFDLGEAKIEQRNEEAVEEKPSPVPLVELHKNGSAPDEQEENLDQVKIQTIVDDSFVNREVAKGIEKKFLVFRPYIGESKPLNKFRPDDSQSLQASGQRILLQDAQL